MPRYARPRKGPCPALRSPFRCRRLLSSETGETSMLNPQPQQPAPFDTARLDELLGEAGIDVLVATSKHNVQYLLGGYRFFFFETMDAIGLSRYLPAFVYRRGHPEDTAYIGYRMETFEKKLDRFWPRTVATTSNTTQDAMLLA